MTFKLAFQTLTIDTEYICDVYLSASIQFHKVLKKWQHGKSFRYCETPEFGSQVTNNS